MTLNFLTLPVRCLRVCLWIWSGRAKQQKRALPPGRGAGPTALPEPVSLLLTPPQVFLHVPPNASPCKARLGCRSPVGRGGSTWPILSGCWSCSLPLSSGLSNGHEGAYNEILSNTILLSASHSTLQPWAQTPVGARALAAPASPSGLSAGDLPSCGIWDCPCEHIGTDRADTDDFLNLCESPCAASSNSSFL